MTKRKENPQNQGPLHPVRIIEGVALKVCGNCKQEKPVAEFWTRASKTKGRAIKSECKTCLYKRRADWKVKNPERMYLLYRRRNVRVTYGLSLETLELMQQMQGNKCAICRGELERPGVKKRGDMHIDHDHQTGDVRGLLCGQCNVGLGSFKDDPETLTAAARYIRRHRGTS